jgi:hypothetical protein
MTTLSMANTLTYEEFVRLRPTVAKLQQLGEVR